MATTTLDKDMTVDPVCGMTVDPATTPRMVLYSDQKFFFCSPGCMNSFRKNPAKYFKSKGIIGRWLERLSKANEKEFGSKGPCCH